MSTNSDHDRWLLPRQQTEYPARSVVPEARLHGRREATFLVLVALFFVTSTIMLVVGTSRVIDLSSLIARVVPGVEMPVEMVLPLGVVPFALSFVASSLACELFGRRRARALLWVGMVASLGIVGLMRLADLIDGGHAFDAALGFAVCYVIAHTFNVIGFSAMRNSARGRYLMLRMNAAALLAYGAGWSMYVVVMRSGYLVEPVASEQVLALTIGAAVWCALSTFVLAIFAVLLARALSVALRVGRDPYELTNDDDGYDEYETENADEPAWAATQPALAQGSVARKLPAAEVIDDDDDDDIVAALRAEQAGPRYARAISVPPYSSAEMRFFTEGDEAEA